MRVLLLNRFWKPFGGVEQVVLETIRVLEDRGHEVVTFAMEATGNWPSPYERYFASNVEFHDEGRRARLRGVRRAVFGSDARDALGRLLDDVPVDLAHAFGIYHHLGTGVLVELRRRKVPTILSLHDYKVACPNANFYSQRTRRSCEICLDHRTGFAWAPIVTRCRGSSVAAGAVLSAEAVVEKVRHAYRDTPAAVTVLNELQVRAARRAGIDEGRIHKVPNIIELDDEHHEGTRERSVLFVGRLLPDKGADVLIRACRQAELVLRIVGTGPVQAELEQLARTMGAKVTFVGSVSRREVDQELRTAGVLAVPSLWPDVAPLVVGEGWSASIPVVGSEVGGLGELLGEGRGVLCPPGDETKLAEALLRVLDRPEDARPLVEAGRAFARAELSRERWIDRMRVVYRAAGGEL